MKNTEMCASKAQYDTSIVQTLEALQPYARQWDELDRRSGRRLPHRSFVWLTAHLAHRLRSNESWLCVMVTCGGRLVGVLPVFHRRIRTAGLRHRIAYTPRDYFLKSIDFIAAPEDHQGALPYAIAAVFRHLNGPLYFQFKQVAEDSPTMQVAGQRLNEFLTASQFDEQGSYLDVSDGGELLWSQVGGNLRRNLARWRKRMEREGRAETVEWISAGKGAEALEVFMTMEAAGWKGRTGTPIVNTESQTSLFRQLNRELVDTGELQWWFLTLSGKPIAGAMARRFADVLCIAKIAYDEQFARLGPGNLLFEDILTYACQDPAINRVDLISDMAWHDRWKARKPRFYHVWFYPANVRSTVLGYLPRRAYQLLRKRSPAPNTGNTGNDETHD